MLAGEPADVFLSANLAYIEEPRDAGLVPTPRPFARNRLAIFVRPEAADRVRTLDDLTRADVRTFMPLPEHDPCGAYTVELFARAGLTARMAEQRAAGRLAILTEGGPAMGELLAGGQIDAFIAYRTIAMRTPDLVLIDLPAPLDMSDRIVFAAGVVVRDNNSHPAALAFVDLLRGPSGWAILDRHGFLPVA